MKTIFRDQTETGGLLAAHSVRRLPNDNDAPFELDFRSQ
jgi:hypothetical protein